MLIYLPFRICIFNFILNFTAELYNSPWLLSSFFSVTQRIDPLAGPALPVSSRNSSSQSHFCPESSSSFSGLNQLV